MPRLRLLAVALLGVSSSFAASAQTISGVVADADHGTPLPGMAVAAYLPDSALPFLTTTNINGQYALQLNPGTYRVLAYDPKGNYATGFNADAPSFEESPETTLSTGQTATVNLVLHLGGRVSGTVSPASGLTPVVAAYNLSGTRRGFTMQISSGAYSMVLPPGTYKLVAYDNNQSFAPIFFNQRVTFADADPVTVTAQSTLSNISFSLQIGSHFAGVVTDTSQTPIANAVVIAYNGAGVQITFAITAQDGTFSMTVPPGTYRFVAIDPSFVHAAGFLSGANSFDSSPAIALNGGQVRTDLVFRLDRGGNVAGVVTDENGAPLRNITVAAFNPDGTQRTFVTTDANGKYVLLLPNGSFRIAAFDPALTFATQFYPQSTNFGHATPVVPAAGQTITLQPFVLSHGGRISGTIADQSTGGSVAGAVVNAYDDSGNLVATAMTAQDGTYHLVVPSGRYRLIAFDPQLRYAPGFAGGVITFSAITPVSVASDTEVTMSFALKRGTIVSGSAVDHRLAPVSGIQITALDLNGNPVETALSGPDGTFKLSLVPGKYKFLAVDPNGRYASAYMGGATFATAQVVTVDATGAPRLLLTLQSASKRRAVSPH